MQPERKRATLYLGLIFLCGALAGAVATNLWMSLGPSAPPARADSPRPSRQRAVEWFAQHLDLSPEQAQQLGVILDETRQAYGAHELEIERIRQQGNDRIRAILNDQQKARFEQILIKKSRKPKRLP